MRSMVPNGMAARLLRQESAADVKTTKGTGGKRGASGGALVGHGDDVESKRNADNRDGYDSGGQDQASDP
jgi:hypothetical protein